MTWSVTTDILDATEAKLNATINPDSVNVTKMLGPSLSFPHLDYDSMLQDRSVAALCLCRRFCLSP